MLSKNDTQLRKSILRHTLWLACTLAALFGIMQISSSKRVAASATKDQVTLRGAEAVAHLKQHGTYDSLAAAVQVARGSRLAANGISNVGNDPLSHTQFNKLMANNSTTLDYFGRAIALSGNTAAIGAPSYNVSGHASQGTVYVFVQTGTGWTQQQQLVANDGAADDGFGSALALSGNTLLVGAQFADAPTQNQGAAYVFLRSGTTWTQQQKLKANDGAVGDQFGIAVALDGGTMLIGAILGDSPKGAAYVFTLTGATWTQQQKLTTANGSSYNDFGNAVALRGNTAVIGATYQDVNGVFKQGAVYVFTRTGTTWTQQQMLTASDGVKDDWFGNAVALSSDGATLVSGAPTSAFSTPIHPGAAYVFTLSGGIWSQQQKLSASDGVVNDRFGSAVALESNTVLVGATNAKIGGNTNQGAVYSFVRSGGGWTQEQKLTASDGSEYDYFGTAVAISGTTELISTAFTHSGVTTLAGVAYIFQNSTAYPQTAEPVSSDGAANDNFGSSVAISGDTAVVGAPYNDVGANVNQGTVYVFVRSGTGWIQQAQLVASDGGAVDLFGFALAISGNTIVVGAYGDDIAAKSDQGSAYVFTRSGTVWTQQQKLTANDGAASDYFGIAVALSDDGNTIIAGAPADDITFTDQGSVYVFVRNGASWTQQQILHNANGAADDNFGTQVAVSGDTALIGDYSDDVGVNVDQGSVFVFTRVGTVWSPQQQLFASDGAAHDLFGASVALSGDTAVIGASAHDVSGAINQGAAYVFTRNGSIWTQQQKLTSSDGAAADGFGIAVSLRQDAGALVVGAFSDDEGGNLNQGSAYLFTRSGNTWIQRQKLLAGDGASLDYFGNAVALSGNTVIVGAPYHKVGANSAQGAAYIFENPAVNLAIAPASLPAGQIAVPYNQTLTASGGFAPYILQLSSGGLPPGLSLAQNGALTGTPTGTGLFNFIVQATDVFNNTGTKTYILSIQGCPVVAVAPLSVPAGTQGAAYNQPLSASGGVAPYSFSVSGGALPTGVTLANGTLTGTPSVSGTFNFTIKATDANNCFGIRPYTLTINVGCPALAINPSSLPDGTVGMAYNQSASTTGGTAPYTYSVSAGSLPGGLNLTSGGALTGTPNAAGVFNFTIKATDANGCLGTRAYTVTITGAVVNNGLQFYPLSRPVRILDTRAGQGNCDNVSTPINGGSSLSTFARLTCEGISIPANAQAIVGNVTVINQTNQTGYMTVYPDGQAAPLAANMIYGPGAILANNFTVGLSANGNFNIFAEKTLDAIVDISGYYAPPAAGGLYYHPLSKPVRLLDTRSGFGSCDNVSTPIPAGSSLTTLARTSCDGLTIPQAAQAIVGNATVINGSGQVGYLTIYPNGVPAPLAANLIYFPGQILANAFTVSLSASGEFNIFGEKTIDMVVDVAGYYSNEASDANGAGLLFTPLATPVRLLDTRAGFGNCDNVNAPIGSGNSLTKLARMTCEGQIIPASAQAVIGNVTVINQTGLAGYLTLYPTGQAAPLAANMIYQPSQILSNAFVVGLSGTGLFNLFAERTLDAIVDVSGFFAP